ncbi:MAG: hypothetical protein AAFP18_02815 [Bacteroidota bacterium]
MLPFRFSTLYALLLAFVALPLAGCDSSDDGDGDGSNANCPNAASGTFTAQAGGSSFDAACIQVVNTSGVFNLTGIENFGQTGNSDQEFLSIVLTNAAVGQFSVGVLGAVVTYSETGANFDPNDAYTAISGSVNVTALSGSAATGTFSVTVRNNAGDQIQISSGSFDVTF